MSARKLGKKCFEALGRLNEWVSNVLFILLSVFLVLLSVSAVKAKLTHTDFSLFGYRGAFILSGSMEPTMQTNCLALMRTVNDPAQLQVGDIVSFAVEESGKEIRISHRIVDITEEGRVVTKGDNNNAEDEFVLTRDDIQYKIVFVWNGFATIVRFLNSKCGLVALAGFALGFYLIGFAVKNLFWKDPCDECIDVELIEDDCEMRKG